MDTLIWHPKILIRTTLTIAAVGSAFLFTRHHLNKRCRRIPLSALPKSSACRNFVETGEPANTPAWGLDSSILIRSWPGDDNTLTHYIPSFVAVQVDIPARLLDRGDASIHRNNPVPLERVKTIVTAFLKARASGPEPWILDRDVPPLEFTPGHHLFGSVPEPGAFLLGTWSSNSRSRQAIKPSRLPGTAPPPVACFPSNRELVRDDGPHSAGLVLYWRAGQGSVKALNRGLVGLGLPWQFMVGGFQEFIVESVDEEAARLTYVSVEASSRISVDAGMKSLGRLPWLLYELHVMYAQSLLLGAVKHLATRRLA